MAPNFKIYSHKNEENLHLKLKGDFDGDSAKELCNVLEKYCSHVKKIFIHTCSLSSVHPFGRDVFQKKYGHSNKVMRTLVFTGEYGNIIGVL